MKEINLIRYDSLILKIMYVAEANGCKTMSKSRRKLGMVWKNDKKYQNIKFYFNNRFNDLTYKERDLFDKPITEVIYRLVNKIETNH